MSKVTSKLQVTIPREVADQYGIRPGDEIEWVSAGGSIRVMPIRAQVSAVTVEERLALFDVATERQQRRQAQGRRRRRPAANPGRGRGWTREDLHTRGRAG
jgi:AbrB family looped-hinge helix DNA binding protein